MSKYLVLIKLSYRNYNTFNIIVKFIFTYLLTRFILIITIVETYKGYTSIKYNYKFALFFIL